MWTRCVLWCLRTRRSTLCSSTATSPPWSSWVNPHNSLLPISGTELVLCITSPPHPYVLSGADIVLLYNKVDLVPEFDSDVVEAVSHFTPLPNATRTFDLFSSVRISVYMCQTEALLSEYTHLGDPVVRTIAHTGIPHPLSALSTSCRAFTKKYVPYMCRRGHGGANCPAG